MSNIIPALNKVLLIGTLHDAPVVKQSQDGGSVRCMITLCVKHGHGDQEELHAVPVIMFGKQAENVAKYMKKDSPLMVEGYLRLYKWADRNGVHHEMLQVVAERTVFMWPDRKKKGTV